MNFKRLYTETNENLELALLSLWAPGLHRMREAMRDLIRREPISAEPVFQSMFPWKNTTDPNWRTYIDHRVIKLQEDKAIQNGRTYNPFEHQTDSWRELHNGNSVVVTSGTGSGKTECFMLPVFSDILSRMSPNGDDPVEAIFLYPLNALMQDQKDRLGYDCEQLGLKFAVYNSSLKDNNPKYQSSYPNAEVLTRKAVREHQNQGASCPQILLTNPSMLEYMLVRDRDQPIFQRSKGKLKWIVIDEAHSYSGSAAIELAYLIKRVLNAFEVNREDVQFVCTSATIGDPSKPQELLDFIETITGKIPQGSKQKLVHIDGNRVLNKVALQDVQTALNNEGIGHISAQNVFRLRDEINRHPMTLSSIWAMLNTHGYNTIAALDLLDKLCNIKFGDDFLLMIKGHFFMRTINGLYTCVNEHCNHHNDFRHTGFPYITTEKGNGVCPYCGAPLLEVVQCGDCKEYMLVCEENDAHEIRPTYITDTYRNFDNDVAEGNDEATDGGSISDGNWEKLYLAYFGGNRNYTKPHPDYEESMVYFSWDGITLKAHNTVNPAWTRLAHEQKLYCPNCVKGSGDDGSNFRNFRISSNWVNSVIAPALLAEGRDAINCWGKYIAFTDSRQGTAINAKRFNIDSERSYSRNRLTSDLSDPNNNPNIAALRAQGYPASVIAAAVAAMGSGLPEYSLSNVAECIFNQDIFDHISFDIQHHKSVRKYTPDVAAYKAALLRSNIGRRPVHLASHESLGIITLVYPGINNATLGNNWTRAGFTLDEFKAYLKICLDFHFRMGNKIHKITPLENQYIREANRSTPYDPAEWPQVVTLKNGQPRITQDRLVLLLCAALGINDINILQQNINVINDLLAEAWNYLSDHILTKVDANDPYYAEEDDNGNHIYDGWYYLDLSVNSNKCKVKIAEDLTICPFCYQLIDTTFRDYSPVIKGAVCATNFDRFKTNTTHRISMPIKGSVNFMTNVQNLESHGLWTDRHKYAYETITGAYLTAEHSGQQDRRLLDHYTAEFKAKSHKLNLLQCSTTMEMGVDIGDIDIVLMTSVPPTSANYLQRAGRAGRRGQCKAIALSLCPHTSIGIEAFRNPMRNLVSPNPAIRPVESAIIIQRHMNSFFVREFVTSHNISFNNVHEWLYDNGFYRDFISWLKQNITDAQLKANFQSIFGSARSMGNAIALTLATIDNIANDYQSIIHNIEAEITNAQTQNNKEKAIALSIQEQAICSQELKGFLAEKQFLPNADMPTGVVEFNYINNGQIQEILRTRQDIERLQAKLQSATTKALQMQLKHKIQEAQSKIEEIQSGSVSSREIKLALSEYAPGQTVVINEKNYVSAGIEWNNSFGQAQPWKYIYHCHTCGRYEYTEDQTLTTCVCGAPFRGLINPNVDRFAMAIEPIRFRTDLNRSGNRQEQTIKTYYKIQTILTNVEWSKCIPGPNCDIIGSDDAQGEIVFYNEGAGKGFNLCLECGKMEVSRCERKKNAWQHNDIREYGVTCPANHPYNHILLTGKFPTSFASLRFYEDATRQSYVKDEELMYSLGVILCRGLVKEIGIATDEVDFDIREEKGYLSLYIYDTSKGGCGYSTELLKPSILNATFNRARLMLQSFPCKCENKDTGACVQCLVDRNSQRHERKLSKHKLMKWFAAQTTTVQVSRTGLPALPIPMNILVTGLYSKTSTTNITFCADASNMNILDWTTIDGQMGRTIHECINRRINVTILIAGLPDNSADASDLLPFVDLGSKFPNCTVKAIKSIEAKPGQFSALTINNSEHYFTETNGALELNESWGTKCGAIYVENNVPSFAYESFPTMNDVLNRILPDEIVLQKTITSAQQTTLKNFYQVIQNQLIGGNQNYNSKLTDILTGKKVDIRFSDSYMNSALAALMLAYMIKGMREKYGFNINSVSLQIQGQKRNCKNIHWNQYSWLSYSYDDELMADEYIKETFENVLGITPDFSTIQPDHCRWLRIKPVGEDNYIEIRPDHGIMGGWTTNLKYIDIDYVDENTSIFTKANTSLVYYLIIKSK